MTRSRKWSRPTLASLAAVAALGSGCNERVPDDEPCYPPLSEREIVEGVTQTLCFDYDGEIAPGERLPRFEGLPEGVLAEEFVYCVDLAPGQTCDGCSLDDTEQLMRDAYVESKECEPPVTDKVGECSHIYETEDGYYAECCTAADCEQIVYAYSSGCAFTDEESGQCCYTAAIASPCAGRFIQQRE